MDEIIKHEEGQVPVKVKLASLPSVAQANVNLFDFEDNLQQCLYDMRDIVTHKAIGAYIKSEPISYLGQ